MKIFQFIPFSILLTLSISAYLGQLRFGCGLGDLANVIGIYAVFILYTIFIFFHKRLNLSTITNIIIPLLALIFALYTCLAMTIWRGVESSWNRQILF